MNKQEAKQELQNLAFPNLDTVPERLRLDDVMRIINQIDETQKPVIPQFVAEWIERVRNKSLNLFDAYQSLIDDDRVKEWFIKPLNLDIFARAWLDGYEIEQEQLYTVEIPIQNLNAHTILQKAEKGIVLVVVTNARWRGWAGSKLTESEIRKEFEWAWNAGFAKEVE